MKTPKPFYRKQRQRWYVQLDGKQIMLGKDEAEAWDKYFSLMASKGKSVTMKPTLGQIVDAYLLWCESNRNKRTTQWYKDFLKTLVNHVGKDADASTLKGYHISSWLAANTQWGQNSKRGAVIAAKRALRWATKEGYLEVNPIASVSAPSSVARDCYRTRDELDQFEAAITEPNLLTIFRFLRHTGCRPEEARTMTPERVDGHCCVIAADEAKGKREQRVVLVPSQCRDILAKFPLTNSNGSPWTTHSLAAAFRRVSDAAGIKVTPYSLRHSFITEALVTTGNPVAVAKIVGHKDLTMIQRVYSHLGKRTDFLQDLVEQVSNDQEPSESRPALVLHSA